MTVFNRTLTATHIAAIGLSLLMGMILLQGVFFYQQKTKAEESRRWVSHTYNVLNAIRTPFAKIKDAQIAQRGYLITGNETFLEPYYAALNDSRAGKKIERMGYIDTNAFSDNIRMLRQLTKDNLEQQRALDQLELLIQEQMDHISASIRIYKQNPKQAVALIKSGEGKVTMDKIRALITEMMRREKKLLDLRLQQDKKLDNQFTWSIIVAALITYTGLLFAIFLITRYFYHLRRTERDLQAKEAYFKAAAEGGTDAFFIFRAIRNEKEEMQHLALEYMNPTALEMAAIPIADIANKKPEEILPYHLDNPDETTAIYLDALQQNKVYQNEYFLHSGSLAGRFYQEQVIPLPDGIAITCRDITDRKAIERMKNEFISTVSHELRTPLTSIRGSLGLVLGENENHFSDDTKELLAIAYNNCERLVRLINDILDIEKIESGKMAFDCKAVALTPLLRQAIDANNAFAQKYKVQLVLENEAEPVQHLHVMADTDRLLQVLTNLISNAAKFSPEGSCVTISCREHNGMAYIAVKDEGAGIPEEFHNQIFQKFAQADSSDTRQKGGTGLGLSIVKAIVEEMGGTIAFTSENGKGSVFYFTLPLAIPQAAPTSSSAIIPAERILVCEDDADIANLLRLILEKSGFSVDVAANALDASALLEHHSYLAMTLDLMLPDKCGISFIRELRNDPRFVELPIIVVSAKADEGRKQLNGDAINIIDWMHKPIDVQKLLRLVQQLRLPSKARILHVEDDAGIADMLRLALGKSIDVVLANSLHSARHFLSSQTFNLVVLDIGLPDGEGTELLPLLGSEGRHPTPVILFTAAEVSQAVSASVAASLTKSRTSEEKLLNTIRQLIGASEKALQHVKEKRA